MLRPAVNSDKNAVNFIRKQVHLMHAAARPDIFRSEFSLELANRFDEFLQSDDYAVAVYDDGCDVMGFVVLKKIVINEIPYNKGRDFLLIEEIGVDEKHRRDGIGSQLVKFAKDYAKQLNLSRIQLDMWSFNINAEEFYLSQGFETYRKYMEIKI